mgnify:FL=1
MRLEILKIFYLSISLLVFNLYLLTKLFLFGGVVSEGLYFLNVGQGDSSLVNFSGASILIDAGRDVKAANELDKILPNRHLDIGIITHSDTDHYAGFYELLKRNSISLLITNGKKSGDAKYNELLKEAARHNIKVLVLGAGDKIKFKNNFLTTISPTKNYRDISSDNEGGLVFLGNFNTKKVLFTADIGFPTENLLLQKFDLANIDILKIGHHGSKKSTGVNFLKTINPHDSIISVGKNSYGHPTKQVLDSVTSSSAKLWRTDEQGTIKFDF